MTVFTEGRHPVEGLMIEGPGSISREDAVVASGAGIIAPGSVLGRITASGKYVLSPETGTDGSQVAVAIALYGCDATSADQEISIIRRIAEWRKDTLTFHASVNDATKVAAKVAQLAAQNIIAR